MDLFALAVKSFYLPRKVSRSQPLAKVMPRSSLPVLGKADSGKINLELANRVNKQCGLLLYRSDPLNGLYDMYNHPEHVQHLLETGVYNTSTNDCDDYATFAQKLFYAAGVSKENAWEWNMIVPWHKQITQGKWNHVICGFRMGEWTGIIDTNSAARGEPFWFQGNEAEVKRQVLETFSKIYPADYYELVPGNWLDYC